MAAFLQPAFSWLARLNSGSLPTLLRTVRCTGRQMDTHPISIHREDFPPASVYKVVMLFYTCLFLVIDMDL